MDMQISQRRLAILWFSISGFLVLLLIVQTIMGHYESPSEAWSWLLPNILPTLSLMIGVLVANAVGEPASPKIGNRTLFWISFGLSSFYLLAILLMILLQPFASLTPLQLMKQGQQLWIAPIQGLVTASLSAFFFKSKA